MNTALTTADLAAAEKVPAAGRDDRVESNVPRQITPAAASAAAPAVGGSAVDGKKSAPGDDELAPLFSPEVAKDFRARWDAVQSGFVDDPKQAVRKGDELVAQVMQSLAESFSKERTKLEGQLDEPDEA